MSNGLQLSPPCSVPHSDTAAKIWHGCKVYFDASLRVPAHCARVSTPYLVCQTPGESSPASPHRKRSWRGRLWDDFFKNPSGLQFALGDANETQVGHALPLRSGCSTATLLLWNGSGPWLHMGCKCGPCASNRRGSWTSPPLRKTRQTFQLSFDYRLHSWSIARQKKAAKAKAAAQRLKSTRPEASCMSDALFLQRLAFAGISQVPIWLIFFRWVGTTN